MNSIKHMLFTNWHFMRWFRLVIGFIVVAQAIKTNELAIGLIGAFFFFQAIANIGCGGVNNCSVPQRTVGLDQKKEIEFEEIKKQK